MTYHIIPEDHMTTVVLGTSVELNLYWKGSYQWYDWSISGISALIKNWESAEIAAYVANINRQLPPNNKQQLGFVVSQTWPGDRKFSLDNRNKLEVTTIKCSAAAARSLQLMVHILYSESQYKKHEVIPPKFKLPQFHEGEKYDIIFTHEDNRIKVDFEKKKHIDLEGSVLNGTFVFNQLEKIFNRPLIDCTILEVMSALNTTQQEVELRQKLLFQTINDYSYEELKIITQLQLNQGHKFPKLHAEEAFHALFSITCKLFSDLKQYLSFLEKIKEFSSAKDWVSLFTFLKQELSIQEKLLENTFRTLLYFTVCAKAEENFDPHLLVYAFSLAPEGFEKEKKRPKYQAWLDQFNLVLPNPSKPLPKLTFWSLFNKVTLTLSALIFETPNALKNYNSTKEEKLINNLFHHITFCYSHIEIKTMLQENRKRIFRAKNLEITQISVGIFEKLLKKLDKKFL